jgi:hypothetical protein
MSYLLAEAICPNFREILVEDIQISDCELEYDETTNDAGVKELQIRVWHWSKEQKLVINRHLKKHIIWDMLLVRI